MDVVKQLVADRLDFFSNRTARPDRAIRINDFIYASPGTSYAYLVLTNEGRIVINTGMGFEAPAHKTAIDAVCPGPTPYIILTQGHVDHVGGVSLFWESDTKVIAQRNNAACQRDDQRISGIRQKQASIWFKVEAALLRDPASGIVQDVPTPDILFDDRYELEVGGLKIELLSAPGETIDSCAVWLPDHRIAFTGNIFGPLFPHFPNFNTIRGDRYRFVEPYLESLRRIRALEPQMLITGRYDPIVGAELIRACLDRLEAAVSYVHDKTLAGMNAGESIWTLMRTVQLPDELFVGQGYGKVSWAVRTIWESYMGWFKAQNTSELYPTQPRDVFADLVELAGVDAVVSRGRQKLDGGDPEAACLIAEAALTHSPRQRDALILARDAHRALLDRSGAKNFWETGWLKDRLARIDADLAGTSK